MRVTFSAVGAGRRHAHGPQARSRTAHRARPVAAPPQRARIAASKTRRASARFPTGQPRRCGVTATIACARHASRLVARQRCWHAVLRCSFDAAREHHRVFDGWHAPCPMFGVMGAPRRRNGATRRLVHCARRARAVGDVGAPDALARSRREHARNRVIMPAPRSASTTPRGLPLSFPPAGALAVANQYSSPKPMGTRPKRAPGPHVSLSAHAIETVGRHTPRQLIVARVARGLTEQLRAPSRQPVVADQQRSASTRVPSSSRDVHAGVLLLVAGDAAVELERPGTWLSSAACAARAVRGDEGLPVALGEVLHPVRVSTRPRQS